VAGKPGVVPPKTAAIVPKNPAIGAPVLPGGKPVDVQQLTSGKLSPTALTSALGAGSSGKMSLTQVKTMMASRGITYNELMGALGKAGISQQEAMSHVHGDTVDLSGVNPLQIGEVMSAFG